MKITDTKKGFSKESKVESPTKKTEASLMKLKESIETEVDEKEKKIKEDKAKK